MCIKSGLSAMLAKPDTEIIDVDLTKKIQLKFGEQEFISSQEGVHQVLQFCYEHHYKCFSNLIENERSFQFYSWCIDRLENVLAPIEEIGCELNLIDPDILPTYKRALRITIEESVFFNLVATKESFNERRFYNLFRNIFTNLHHAIYFSSILNLLKIVRTPIYIVLQEGRYQIKKDVFFEFQHKAAMQDLLHQSKFRLGDQALMQSFETLIEKELGCSYNDWIKGLNAISSHLIHNNLDPIDWNQMIRLFTNASGACENKSKYFFKGVLLLPDIVQGLEKRIYRPNPLDRQLYRPVLEWTLDNCKKIVIRRNTFMEALSFLIFDAAAWHESKIPKPWLDHLNAKEHFINGKKNIGKILEDKVDEILADGNFKYVRTFTYDLSTTKKETESEIDFVFLDESKRIVYLGECKNLIARFDTWGWFQDKQKFSPGSKNIKQMERHIRGIQNSFNKLCLKFREKYDCFNEDLSQYKIQPMFILNSPTLFMHNSEIFTISWKHFEQMVIEESFKFSIIYFEPGIAVRIQYPFFLNAPSNIVVG